MNWCSRSRRGKRPLSFRPGKQAFHWMGRRFWRSAKTHTATHGGLFILCISKILRQAVITLQQIHFGSQCATERVYRYLLAKVELKKSHFGKTPLTECALCSPPCQSELAELRERNKKAQSRPRPCAILQISVYKRILVGPDDKMSKHCSVRIISHKLRDATAFI